MYGKERIIYYVIVSFFLFSFFLSFFLSFYTATRPKGPHSRQVGVIPLRLQTDSIDQAFSLLRNLTSLHYTNVPYQSTHSERKQHMEIVGCWSFRDLPFRDPYTFAT